MRKYWTDATGKRIEISKMSDSHLDNAIAYIDKWLVKLVVQQKMARDKLKDLKDERERREEKEGLMAPKSCCPCCCTCEEDWIPF